MSDQAHWQEGNDRYLAAALDWLRLRLEWVAGPETASSRAEEAAAGSGSRWSFRRWIGPEADGARVAPSKPSANISDSELAKAEGAMKAAEALDPPPALLILSRLFGLSLFEQNILLLCSAIELDTRIAHLCARVQDDPGRSYPTFAMALAVFDDPAWDALSAERPLRYWRLIEINQPGAQALTTSPLRADERIVNYLKGLNYLDDRLAPLLTPLDWDGETPESGSESPLSASQQAVVDRILHTVRASMGSGRPPVIQLTGPDLQSKGLVAWEAGKALGISLYRLPAEMIPLQAGEMENLLRLWGRESVLLPIGLFLDAQEVDGSAAPEGQSPPVQRFLARNNGLTFLVTREVWPGLQIETAAFDVLKPAPVEQQEAWEIAIRSQSLSETDRAYQASLLAGQFNLNLPAIQEIARRVIAETSKEDPLHKRLWSACLNRTRPRLEKLAQRLEPKATWDDIVLPEPEAILLQQIAIQVGQRSKVYDDWGFRQRMNRGLGISALFAGESGTGKTMAAEVIANDLRLNLYRIDLSAVVSKYIGETEKNLRRLFDAAEDGGAILFFDEADALFGKRSEVKDSHDRYANIEINYLLQRMEGYHGLAILATNMKSALDAAFMRRLRFIVNFPFPGPKERMIIWQKVFPQQTPKDALDYDRLARLNLTGGSIQNIAINAAFLAAQQGKPVSMSLILDAARTEFRKLDKPVNEADFRWTEPIVAEA